MKGFGSALWIIPEAGPDFVCAMEEVPDVYARPYNPEHPVIRPDESPKQYSLPFDLHPQDDVAAGIKYKKCYVLN
ncbi:hypothetical protein QUF90_11180 [Desulfococcaceae bacterium HSG9]|nr:hypothetical protein [Desulfococcaceae bacterium HSG9]